MTAAAKELVELVGALPEDKARAVVDFARFLQHQADDAAWESIIGDTLPQPKLDAFAADALREGIAAIQFKNRAAQLSNMQTIEFETELKGKNSISIPREIVKQLPASGKGKEIFLVQEGGEDAERRQGGCEQFLDLTVTKTPCMTNTFEFGDIFIFRFPFTSGELASPDPRWHRFRTTPIMSFAG